MQNADFISIYKGFDAFDCAQFSIESYQLLEVHTKTLAISITLKMIIRSMEMMISEIIISQPMKDAVLAINKCDK